MKRKDLVAVKIDRQTHEALRNHKDKTGVSITFAIGKAVEEYFAKMEVK